MNKKISVMLVFVFVMMALAIPTFAQDDPWADVDPSGQNVVFWYRVTGSDEEGLQELISEFNASNMYGITVEGYTQGGYNELSDKMMGTIGTEDQPNVIIAYQNNMLDYYTLDGLAVLDDLVASPTWGLTEEDLADFIPGFINQDVFPNIGRLGMPPQRSMAVMYYNVDWLDELASNDLVSFEGPPVTPEQFKEAACAAAANPFSASTGDVETNTGYGFRFDASQLASWVFAFGDDLFDYDNTVYTFDSPEAVASMEFVADLFASGCAKDYVGYDDQAAFGQGVVMFVGSSTSGMSYWQDAVDGGYGGNWAVTAYPYPGDSPAMNVYGASVSIGANEPEAVLASWLFVKFLTSTETSATWADVSDYFPVRYSSADLLGDWFEANPNFAIAWDLLPYGIYEPPVAGYDPVRRLIADEYLIRIFEGEDVTTVMGELNVEANEILVDAMDAME
jgi:multiple sugar transport system substrate-binding protein/sn-glycerol 3-phosphate transport system substrate-binding protein